MMDDERILQPAPTADQVPEPLAPQLVTETPELPQVQTDSLILNAQAVSAPAVAEALLDYLTSPGSAESTLAELPVP